MKGKKTTPIFTGFVIVTLLTSCATYYTPNSNPLPLFKSKGDFYLNFSSNLKSKIDLTAAYAVTNNIACYAGHAGAYNRRSDEAVGIFLGSTSNYTVYKYNGQMQNFGLGYYLNQSQSENVRFEIFGDVAKGAYRNVNELIGSQKSGVQTMSGQFLRTGVLANIGFNNPDKGLTFAYTMRCSNITFSKAQISDTAYWKDEQERMDRRHSFTMLEHGLAIELGRKNVRFTSQLGLYHNLNTVGNGDDIIPSFGYSFMFGIMIRTNFMRPKG